MVEPVQAGEDAVPLVVEFTMEPDAADAQKLVDTGPLGYHGTIENARVVDGYRGKGLRFDGVGAMAAAGIPVELTVAKDGGRGRAGGGG